MQLPDPCGPERRAGGWSGLPSFLEAFDEAAAVLATPDDYTRIAFDYLRAAAAEGAIYVELTVSPDHAAANGVGEDQHLGAVADGIAAAHAETGVEARMIVTAVRHFGVGRAERAARLAAAGHPLVVGFGLAGDEAVPPGAFAHAFEIAADAGLGCTVHAGEAAGPESVRAALQLPVTRIGHGVAAARDEPLMRTLARRGVALECCLSSNVDLGVVESVERHPLPRFLDAGISVSLGSDDPPFFATTIGGEYRLAAAAFSLGEEDLLGITRMAVAASFADAATKRRLLERIDAPTGERTAQDG